MLNGPKRTLHLRRLEVDGGFLDGLDLSFEDGLNVLIGPRGSGKTSVIELLRYCLDVGAVTDEAAAAAQRQVTAVLGGGTVRATVETAGVTILVSRSASDLAPRFAPAVTFVKPLLIAQSEIEAIGLDPASRRQIIDSLGENVEFDESDLVAKGKVVCADLLALERDLEETESSLDQLSGIDDALEAAEVEAANVASTSEDLDRLRTRMREIGDALGAAQAREAPLARARSSISEWNRDAEDLRDRLPTAPGLTGQPAASLAAATRAAREALGRAVLEMGEAAAEIARAQESALGELGTLQSEQTRLTAEIDQLQQGAGEVTRRISQLRQQAKTREALKERREAILREKTALYERRAALLTQLDEVRQRRFEHRDTIAKQLNAEFGGDIEIRISKTGATETYERLLAAALQDSGLQYRALARQLAGRMSPRELIEACERGDYKAITLASGISDDRAIRLAAHVRHHGAPEVLFAPLEDAVDFALLDGQTYKTTANLSMGQRCTVVLPLLLAQPRGLTILDQPEDHLDNAFIVETVVDAIRSRSSSTQFLVATHNANIPVLGEAAQVVVMASDGRHGYIDTHANLDEQTIIDAISDLMEGGAEAFQKRAQFYASHGE